MKRLSLAKQYKNQPWRIAKNVWIGHSVRLPLTLLAAIGTSHSETAASAVPRSERYP
jgi:hypothetical protein